MSLLAAIAVTIASTIAIDIATAMAIAVAAISVLLPLLLLLLLGGGRVRPPTTGMKGRGQFVYAAQRGALG